MAITSTQQNRKGDITNGGYALYTAIILTGMLILVSYATANLSIKELLISVSNADSHIAFYNADSGLECALYSDLQHGAVSAFDTVTAGTITCSGQTITTGSQTVATTPSQSSVIGGGGPGSVSIFQITLPNGCAIVAVTKNNDGSTTIQSYGYNSCSGSRRLERGVEITY
jgi:Tfp pilus assembly protein PilX